MKTYYEQITKKEIQKEIDRGELEHAKKLEEDIKKKKHKSYNGTKNVVRTRYTHCKQLT